METQEKKTELYVQVRVSAGVNNGCGGGTIVQTIVITLTQAPDGQITAADVSIDKNSLYVCNQSCCLEGEIVEAYVDPVV